VHCHRNFRTVIPRKSAVLGGVQMPRTEAVHLITSWGKPLSNPKPSSILLPQRLKVMS
jgi:hypothetical protein